MLPNKTIQNISTIDKLDWYQILIARSRGVIIQIEIMSTHVQETKMPKPKILQWKDSYFYANVKEFKFSQILQTINLHYCWPHPNQLGPQ